jgi:integrase/recombinase XerD
LRKTEGIEQKMPQKSRKPMSSDALQTQFESYLLTEKRVCVNTFSAYQQDIAQFVSYLEHNQKTLEQTTIADVKDYLRYLKETLVLSARSITRKISALKVLFAYAHERHGMPNLAQDLTFPKLEKKLPEYLSEQEIEKLLATADADTSLHAQRNKVLLYLLYVSGMRISELTNLAISSIHFDTGFIHVQGKGGKGRMIPLPAPILGLLKTHIATVQNSAQAHHQKTDYLFPIIYAGTIRPITRQACWTIVTQLCKKAGIERKISPHKLRHSLATHMLKSGADLRSLQMLLGHENLATVQIYTHVETSYLRNIYNKKHPRS